MPTGVARQKTFEFFVNSKGINENDGILRLTPESAVSIINMHPTKTGEFTTHNCGYSEFSDQLESGADIDGVALFKSDSGATSFMVATNGKVLDVNTSTGALTGTITSANTAGEIVTFAPFKGSMYFAEETMEPNVWSGSGASSTASGFPKTIGSDTYSKPSLVATHANRVIYGNFNGSTKYPSHLLIYDDLDPTTITTATTNDTNGAVIQINPGDGDALTALKSKFVPALGESILICFKSASVWALTGTTPTTFAVLSINPSWGCLNSRCAVDLGQDIVFMGRNNIYSLTTAAASGTLQPETLGSKMVQETLSTLNLSAADKAYAVHLPFRHEVWFGIPTGASTTVDTILVYNYRHKDINEPKWIIRKNMDATCGVVKDADFYTGDGSGYLNVWFGSSKYKEVAYPWEYHIPFYDFGQRGQYKRIVELFAHFRVRRETTITFEYSWKIGGNNTRRTTDRTLSGSLVVYGTAVYGTSQYSTSDAIRVIKIPVVGNGALFDLTLTGTNGDVGLDFIGVSGVAEYGDFIKRYN